MDTTRVRTERVMDLEEALHLVDDAVEVPGLVPGRRGVGVPVHRIGLPDHLVAGRLHRAHDRREYLAHLRVAHAGNEGQPSGTVVRVEPFGVFDGLLRRRRRSDLDPDGVTDQLGECDVRSVELAGALADPEEVRRKVVEHLLVEFGRIAGTVEIGIVGQAQHRAFVVEHERFV